LAADMHWFYGGGQMQFKILFIFIMFASVSYADSSPLKSATSSFQLSQDALRQALGIKSLDRLLSQLDKAEQQLLKAKKSSFEFVGDTEAQQRLQLRLSAKLLRDLAFLKALREDLGLAEHDTFEVYGKIRKTFLKEASQIQQVKQMDSQILLTVEKFFHEKYLNRL